MINLETFAMAGKAVFTVVSKRTGTRFTFKVQESKDGKRHYVKVLTGPDNTSNYQFFGTIFGGTEFRHGKPDKTAITPAAPSAVAFRWVWNHIADENLADKVEVFHEGKCCRCGRALTVPESIESGVGPECRSKMGL